MATCVYNPLAGGLLTGKHRHDAEPEASGRFGSNQFYRERFWHAPHFEAVRALAGLAAGAERSLIGLSFRWLLDRDDVQCVILGASSMSQLEANLTAIDEQEGAALDDATTGRCDEIYRELRGFPPKGVVR
jgi:aryl-alcohol dehydrogenase-like predicted oxidoreductase